MYFAHLALACVIINCIECSSANASNSEVSATTTTSDSSIKNVCDKDNIDLFLLNGSLHLWYDLCHRRRRRPHLMHFKDYYVYNNTKDVLKSRSINAARYRSNNEGIEECKPSCNLVLHRTGCLSKDNHWTGALCPASHPDRCRRNRFACTQYGIADLVEALKLCQDSASTVKWCAEQRSCDMPAIYSAREQCAWSRHRPNASSVADVTLPIVLPLNDVQLISKLQNEVASDFDDRQMDITVRIYATQKDAFRSLRISLFDPYVILFREFKLCLEDLFESNRIVLLYLRDRGQIFEFRYPNSSSDTMSICTLTASDSRLVISNALMVIGTILSMSGLLLTIFSVVITREHVTIPGINLLCLSSSLIVTYVTVVVTKSVRNIGETCLPEGILHVVGVLATLTWSNIMAFDIWHTLSKMHPVEDVSSSMNKWKLFKYCCYGWGLPVAILVIGITTDRVHFVPLHFKPMFSLECWFSMGFNTWGTVLFYYGPIALIMLLNLSFFVMTAKLLLHSHHETRREGGGRHHVHKKVRYLFKLYIKLFLVMGLTWVLEVTNLFFAVPELYITNDFINTMQGFFIFIIFACRPKVFKSFCFYCCPSCCSNVTDEDLRTLKKFNSVPSSRKSSLDQYNCKNVTCTKI